MDGDRASWVRPVMPLKKPSVSCLARRPRSSGLSVGELSLPCLAASRLRRTVSETVSSSIEVFASFSSVARVTASVARRSIGTAVAAFSRSTRRVRRAALGRASPDARAAMPATASLAAATVDMTMSVCARCGVVSLARDECERGTALGASWIKKAVGERRCWRSTASSHSATSLFRKRQRWVVRELAISWKWKVSVC